MQQTNTYQKQSRIFFTQAFEDLEKGDLPQASEKAWLAAAQLLKAIAQEKGLDHCTHRDLFLVVGTLVEETGDSDLAVLFNSVGFLHMNFYENAYSSRAVEASLLRAVRFVDKAEKLLEASA